ncbi:IS66 family insertion sequence element accessory protein TnpA, partial [Paenibacillus popilliae]
MDSKWKRVYTKLLTDPITAYQTSGQTMKAWCKEHDLTVHQLKYWLYK